MEKETIANTEDAVYFKSLIKRHPLFQTWPNELVTPFCKLWKFVTFESGDNIVIEGEEIDNVYIIVRGNCEVITHPDNDPNKVNTLAMLSTGDSVGLSATGLFSQTSQRTATVIALTTVTALMMKLKTLQTFLQQHPNLNVNLEKSVDRYFKLQLAKESIPFGKLSPDRISNLADKIGEVEVPAHHVIFKEGDNPDFCYFIYSGKVGITKESKTNQPEVLAVLSSPAIFGETAIILNTTRNATATTISDCKLYRLHQNELKKLFQEQQNFADSISTLIIQRSRPRQIADIVERQEKTQDKSNKVVLKNIRNKELYKLNDRSYFVWKMMDGKKTIADIISAMEYKYGRANTSEVLFLISDLYNNGFIEILGYNFPKTEKLSIWNKLMNVFK